MFETKFFERVDRFSVNNVWRILPDGRIDCYNHATRWWQPSQPDFNLNDPKEARPISFDRVRFLQEIGI